jgi:hypothetical protein
MAARGRLLVTLLLLALAAAAGGRHRGKQARLELVPAAPGASLADRAADDRHRHAHISARLRLRRRRAAEAVGASAFAMPLTSGAYTGTGQYFVRFRVGTPAQPFVLVADTGSDLTWVKCRAAASSPRVFRPADSKTWAPIPCSSDTCTSYVPFSLANCSSATGPCAYDYRSVFAPDIKTPPPMHFHLLSTALTCRYCYCIDPADLATLRHGRPGWRPRPQAGCQPAAVVSAGGWVGIPPAP